MNKIIHFPKKKHRDRIEWIEKYITILLNKTTMCKKDKWKYSKIFSPNRHIEKKFLTHL